MALGENKILALRMRSQTTSAAEYVRQVVEFITGDHAQEGPVIPWTVIEADDTSRRDTPSGGNSSADDIPVANLWNPTNSGDLPTGSWCVVESADSDEGPGVHLQILFDVVSATSLDMYLIPKADFVTGGGTTGGALPTLPTDNFGSGTIDYGTDTAYICVCGADEGKIWLTRGEPGVAHSMIYAGELFNPPIRGGATAPIKRYAVRRVPDRTPPVSGGESSDWAVWDHNQDRFMTGTMREIYDFTHAGGSMFTVDESAIGPDGTIRFGSIALASFETGSEGIPYGYLRDVYIGNWQFGDWGQTADRKVIWWSASVDDTLPLYAFAWDGVRDFPFNAA